MMHTKLNSSILIFGLLAASSGFAQTVKSSGATDISILPLPGPNMGDIVVDSNLTINGGDTTILDIYPSCYGTNLRSVANPVSPSATIKASFQYLAGDGTYQTYNVKFPAGVALSKKLTPSELTSGNLTADSSHESAAGVVTTTKFTTHFKDNLIRVAMKQTKTIGLDVLASGGDFGNLADTSVKQQLFKAIWFSQEMPVGSSKQQYMGWNGPLSASVRWYFSENGKHATVYAAFPGQNGYCGGYYSPLMLKFAKVEEPPRLEGTSYFPLFQKDYGNKAPAVSWPSFNKEEDVYFLALDINGNGKIDHGGELLGDINGFEDGFANLAIYDSNKDGVIDAKDPIFAKLLLWKDSNKDGKSSKTEITHLKDRGITSISLKYEKLMRTVANKGKILGPGQFTYADKTGKVHQGSVWDVFMQVGL